MEIIIFGILILLIICFLVFSLIPFKQSSKNIQVQGPNNLNTSSVIISKNSDFQVNSSATFQGLFYLENLQKTSVLTPCSTTDPSLPNCDTGRYSLCSCAGSDCSRCRHVGYSPIININGVGVLEILNAPDASRQGKAQVQFTIRTQSAGQLVDNSNNLINPDTNAIDVSGTTVDVNRSGSTIDVSGKQFQYIETFVLPTILYQKWTMITISREGRRFDFYYNDRLVLSKYASTNIYNLTANEDITIGNTNINGSSGYFTIYPTIQSAIDIAKQYSSFVNTRGSPLFDKDTPTIANSVFSLDRLSQIGVPSLCPSGDCITTPTNPPSKPFYEWSSSYA